MTNAVYGAPPPRLAPGAGAQLSPLVPGSTALESLARGSLVALSMLAPPGVIERRYAIALALRALKVGGELIVLAPKDKGGSRLAKELAAFGTDPQETFKQHHRICVVARPETVVGLDEALEAGAPRQGPDGLWTQPGVFSWDRIDPGTALLAELLPVLSGEGADFGCGVGVLSLAALASPKITKLAMIDTDRRAIEAAKRNVTDKRAQIQWADLRQIPLTGLDFVVMNPPFHDGGREDQSLGLAFIQKAAGSLRKGGGCWLVANRHLPYEAELAPLFSTVTLKGQTNGYKVYEARK
jgi:16S rRNA (guanine1207-N2)-methyltransferase